jgi:hypothetical protein
MVFAKRENPYMRIKNANISFELYNPNFTLHVSCGRNHPSFSYFSRQKIQGTYNVKERRGGGGMNHTPFLWGWTKEYNTRDNKQKHESLGVATHLKQWKILGVLHWCFIINQTQCFATINVHFSHNLKVSFSLLQMVSSTPPPPHQTCVVVVLKWVFSSNNFEKKII